MALPDKSPDHNLKEIERLKSERNKLKNEVKEKNREIRNLKSKLEDQSKKSDEIIKELQDRITVLEIEAVDGKVQIEELERQIGALQSKNSYLKKNLEEYKKSTNEEIQTLKINNSDLRKSVDELKKNIDSHMIYIAQISFKFRENAYYIVMGEDFYENFFPAYDLEEIDSEISKISNDVTRKEAAQQNWKWFQEKVGWRPEKTKVLIQIRKDRNEVAHPEDLDEARAKEAIQELHKQKKLKGIISKDKVQNIVDMWSISERLLAP